MCFTGASICFFWSSVFIACFVVVCLFVTCTLHCTIYNNNKLILARQELQPSWWHLIRWSSMLDSHHRVNSSLLRWSPTAQSTGMLFRSWASWADGDWRRQPGVFEHLHFCFNGFPLWCNDLILFCCTMVLLMTTGHSRVHYQRICISFGNFEPPRVFRWLIIDLINNNKPSFGQRHMLLVLGNLTWLILLNTTCPIFPLLWSLIGKRRWRLATGGAYFPSRGRTGSVAAPWPVRQRGWFRDWETVPCALQQRCGSLFRVRHVCPLSTGGVARHSTRTTGKASTDARETRTDDNCRRTGTEKCVDIIIIIIIISWRRGWVVRTSAFGWRTLRDLRLIYDWHMTTSCVVSAMGQAIRPIQPTIPSGSATE